VGRAAVIVAALSAVLVGAGTASAAQLIGRNATGVTIETNGKGEALFSFRQEGRFRHVLVWGAIDARTPARGAKQVEFKVDYSGGWKTRRTTKFSGTCAAYDGPALPNLVAACKAPDGTYWAAQSWPRPLPNLGFTPWTAELGQKWLEVSHWSGELARFEVGQNWIWDNRWQSIFGRLTYKGQPVYGFGTTRYGVPTDGFGTLVYLDTFNSAYGSGWKRENSFVPHNPSGVFCYGFFPFDPTKGGYKHPPGQTARRGPGTGERYRLTASGPGVTPNISVVVAGGHPFDRSNSEDALYSQEQAAVLRSWGDKSCRIG
jgi:hypothetical protein